MNTSHGWIKLYRCLLDDPIWQCSTSEQKVILVTLLLMANHAERKWQWNGMPYQCQPGQMITSLKSIRDKCGKDISIYNIRTAIKRFETFGFLTNRSTNQSRMITICNWERYQAVIEANDKQPHNRPTSDPQTMHRQPTPNKNVKNEKNENTHRANYYLSTEELEIQRASEATDRAIARWLAEGD